MLFHRKMRNALRVSKTVFLKEKGNFEMVFHMKRVPFSPNLFFMIREAKVGYDFVQYTTWLGCAMVLFQQKLVWVTFFLYVNSFRGWQFHQGVKTCSGGFGEILVMHLYTVIFEIWIHTDFFFHSISYCTVDHLDINSCNFFVTVVWWWNCTLFDIAYYKMQ